MAEIAGFWSYTHDDNGRDRGRVLRLAELLTDEFALITGSTLEVFVDRNSLKWGDEWTLRIENALATTTFFIPVITPLYFKSEECRKELLGFVGHARSVGAEDLVLPLLYLDVPQLHVEDPGDEAVAVVKSRQWQDCRDLRLLAEDDPAYRQKVNALAGRLIEIDESLPNESLPPENKIKRRLRRSLRKILVPPASPGTLNISPRRRLPSLVGSRHSTSFRR